MVVIRRAAVGDITPIQALVNGFADKDRMLHRSLSELYENVRDFLVADEDGEVVGCCALHVVWADLAEVKSLAVASSQQGKGLGRRLVEACVEEAGRIGIPRVFCLTYEADFFSRCGFHVVDRAEFPRKVWSECIRCPKFFNCTEIAMTRQVGEAPAGRLVAAEAPFGPVSKPSPPDGSPAPPFGPVSRPSPPDGDK